LIEFKTKGSLEMWTLDNPEPIRGRSYKRWVLNEAASVENLMPTWNSIIRPTLIDQQGGAWFLSTPKGRNAFYQLYTLALTQKDMQAWTFTSYSNPHILASELDAIKETMSENEYRQEVLAEFLEGEGTVFRNIEACSVAPLSSPHEHEDHPLVAGVDWGQQNDFTVISVGCAKCKREVFLDRFNQIDYGLQRMRLTEAVRKWGIRMVIAELNAMGTPVVEQLQRDGMSIIGFTNSIQSKMVLIDAMALVLEQGTFQFINNQIARAEMEAYEMRRTVSGMRSYASPQGMNDDTVIARALMLKAIGQAPLTSQVHSTMADSPIFRSTFL
jgi:hypothetical protein